MEDLIYDRIEEDVNNRTLKGLYNYTDLNRVESWCKYLADLLNSSNYIVDIKIKTDWTMFDFPYQSQMERIRENLKTLKQAFFCYAQIPENLELMTYQKANDIERILHELDYFIKCMENNFVYAGVCGAGQNRVWQQRFRRKYTYIVEFVWSQVRYSTWLQMTDSTSWEEVGWGARDTEL